MSDLSEWEYLQDKRMNDYEESFDMTDKEHQEALNSPCRNCDGKRRGKCHGCEV